MFAIDRFQANLLIPTKEIYIYSLVITTLDSFYHVKQVIDFRLCYNKLALRRVKHDVRLHVQSHLQWMCPYYYGRFELSFTLHLFNIIIKCKVLLILSLNAKCCSHMTDNCIYFRKL